MVSVKNKHFSVNSAIRNVPDSIMPSSFSHLPIEFLAFVVAKETRLAVPLAMLAVIVRPKA